MRVLELFSGLGGWRLALGHRGTVAAAYDVSEAANATYALNHGEAPKARELATIPMAELAAEGIHLGDRLHSPVGLDLGAEDPETIALAVLAEIQAHFQGRTGGSLRATRTAVSAP